MKRLMLALALTAGLTGTAAQADDALKAAIASKTRTEANVARDAHRHPYETLSFFGIKPTMTVVELHPSGGWYTEILAPYLRDKGSYIGATQAAADNRYAKMYRDKLASNPAIYDKAKVAVFDPHSKYDIAPAGSVDMVLTFRNLHNWTNATDAQIAEMFKAIHTALKPGGVLGVVDHRWPASRPFDPKANNGYLPEAMVVKMIEAAGFKLAAKSEVNANAKDTADHKRGVRALPPTLANKDEDRAKYLAIGESDRMTLKFVKQ